MDNVSGSPDNEIVKIQLTFFCLIAIKKLPVLNGTHYSVLFVVVRCSSLKIQSQRSSILLKAALRRATKIASNGASAMLLSPYEYAHAARRL